MALAYAYLFEIVLDNAKPHVNLPAVFFLKHFWWSRRPELAYFERKRPTAHNAQVVHSYCAHVFEGGDLHRI